MYKKYYKLLLLFIIGFLPFFIIGCNNDGKAQGIQIPFGDTKIIIEFNSTGEDAGIQVFLDGEPWENVKIFSPDGQIFEVQGSGNLKELGLTELFFESNEPSLDELPLDEFLAMFPEGDYQFEGLTVEGDNLVGTATLTHDIPCGPEILSPAEGAVVNPNNTTVIEWEEVTNKLGPDGECDDSSEIEIFGYQVIVEREDPLRVFSVDLPASAREVTVPSEFLEPDTEYDFEVLAIEERGIDEPGNQTISEGFFCTDPLTPCLDTE